MDEKIKAALSAPPDYSEGFRERMEALCSRLQPLVDAPVYLDSDMNYASAQKLSVFVDREQRPVPRDAESSCRELVFLISSRADLFAAVELERNSGNEWRVSRAAAASRLSSKLAGVIEEAGYEAVHEGVLSEMAPGRVTEMDGAPATVFQVLFSEMF